MQFAELLKQERMKNKISLRKLARLSGVSFSSIAKYESGEMEPTLRAAHTVFSALGTSITVGEGTDYTPVREFKKGGRKDASA